MYVMLYDTKMLGKTQNQSIGWVIAHAFTFMQIHESV